MPRSAFVFALLGLSIGAAGFAQQTAQPAVTFKSEVGVVEINAVVTDAAGNFVRGLTKDDFQISEDGRVRPLSLFSLVDLPALSVPRAGVIEADVRTLAESQNGRVYVLVLDDLHISPLRTTILKAAARRFIEQHFFPGDLAAVIYTGPGQAAAQALTGSRRLLLAAIDRFHGQQIDSAADGRLETYRQQQLINPDDQQTGRLDDPNDAERSFNARRALNTLRDAASWMADIQGRRKSLLFFSEGIDYDITDVFSAPGASDVLMDARDAVGSATRSNVSIYSIDPRGLSGLSDEFITLIEPQTPTRTAREQLGTRAIDRDLHVAQDSLRMLAEQTGGLAIVNSNDFAVGFERIVRDNSLYYLLGYYAQPGDKGGKFRKIDVRVRRPGLAVRARRGYVTPETKKESPASSVLQSALRSPMAAGNLPMRVFAAPFKGDEKHASVLVVAEIDGESLTFKERDRAFLDDLEFSIVAVGPSGRAEETDSGRVSLNVKPDIRQQIAGNGVRFLSRMALPPARYQLRVASREAGAGRASVVDYDLEVPDFTKEPLAISGLILTTASAGETATPRGDAALRAVLPRHKTWLWCMRKSTVALNRPRIRSTSPRRSAQRMAMMFFQRMPSSLSRHRRQPAKRIRTERKSRSRIWRLAHMSCASRLDRVWAAV